jgi:Tfp pilus assembly protein PilO
MTEPHRDDWHLDKRVPIGILIVILIQTIGFVYWFATWKAQMDEWRVATTNQIAALSVSQPRTSNSIAALEARATASDRAVTELKADIVARLDRQDKKLDAIVERIDKLRNGN